jgi:sugar lactone lactonase YvrE
MINMTKRFILAAHLPLLFAWLIFPGCDPDSDRSGKSRPPPEGTFAASRLDGFEEMLLPATPSGFMPDQSYYAIGSDDQGDMYVAASDHLTNSVLYRCSPSAGQCRFVGDARSASEAVGYWNAGETAEKFHTRPTWFQGRMYVATMDYSLIDKAYLTKGSRLHIYAYDPATGSFEDKTATDPNRAALGAVNIVALAADVRRGRLWGVSVQEGRILEYDPQSNRTVLHGRPGDIEGLVDPGRFLLQDQSGALYTSFAAGERPLTRFDPESDQFLPTDFLVKGQLKCGVKAPDGGVVYLLDIGNRLYSYVIATGTFTPLGPLTPDQVAFKNLNLSEDGRFLYSVESSERMGLYEFEIATGQSRRLVWLADYASLSGSYATGYESRDQLGYLYLTVNAVGARCGLLRIHPARIQQALGLP